VFWYFAVLRSFLSSVLNNIDRLKSATIRYENSPCYLLGSTNFLNFCIANCWNKAGFKSAIILTRFARSQWSSKELLLEFSGRFLVTKAKFTFAEMYFVEFTTVDLFHNLYIFFGLEKYGKDYIFERRFQKFQLSCIIFIIERELILFLETNSNWLGMYN